MKNILNHNYYYISKTLSVWLLCKLPFQKSQVETCIAPQPAYSQSEY
jgi:hypothetical protein